MGAFKDAIMSDVVKVFLNADEFAETHELNGVEIPLVIDTSIIAEGANNLEGVFLNTKTLYVSAEDIDPAPVEGEILTLDGDVYLVRRVSIEQGVLNIIIEANEQ